MTITTEIVLFLIAVLVLAYALLLSYGKSAGWRAIAARWLVFVVFCVLLFLCEKEIIARNVNFFGQ